MITCSLKGCTAEARWRLYLRLFVEGNSQKGFPDADPNLNVCYKHGENPSVDELLSLDNQRRILDGLRAAGAPALPDFSRTKFVLVSLYGVGEKTPTRRRLLLP